MTAASPDREALSVAFALTLITVGVAARLGSTSLRVMRDVIGVGSATYMVGLRRVANPGVGQEQRTAQVYPGGVGTPAGRTFSISEATAYAQSKDSHVGRDGQGARAGFFVPIRGGMPPEGGARALGVVRGRGAEK